MNLTVDIGNSFVKIGLFNNDKLVTNASCSDVSAKLVADLQNKYGNINNAIISDVNNSGKKIKSALKEIPQQLFLSNKTRLPFVNKYETPATLGTDRISLAAGALKYFPGKNVLVISAGTCVTYDFINRKKEYTGGSISPGLMMRLAALNHFTARLPLLKPSKIKMLTGKTTRDSILSGVLNGITFEMDGFISEYRKMSNDVKVILTGGDAALFAERLKNSIFAAPELTLFGLNEILKHNVR